MSAYEPLFRHLFFPAYESVLMRRKTLAYLREYQRNQWMTPEEISALQWLKLKRLLAHCWAEVPYYRQQWRELGLAGPQDIRTRSDYARLPVLTKQGIRDNFEAMHARSLRGALLYKATGGSTGEPLRFGYSRESYERRIAVMWRGYGAAGVPLGGRTLYLWGGSVGDLSRAALLKERLYHGAFNRRMLNCFSMREDNLALFASAIESFKPRSIVAYVGPIVRLAQWMIENRKTIQGVKSILGAAESLHRFQRPVIEAAFPGATTYNTYGCREFMLIGGECEYRDGLHVNADHLLVELLPTAAIGVAAREPDRAGPVEAGEVVTTDLGNFGMPFIRYAGGDIAFPGATARCRCGRGLPRLRRVEGRKLDAIRTPGGHLLPGEFFPHLLKDVTGIHRFQVVQHRLDDFTISIVPGTGFDGGIAEQYIRREVHKVIGDASTLTLRLVDDIPLTPTGKFRVTISELT